ncbi:MAG TPA: hypothetical protein VH583_21975 [Vicinamibacterales bacterium]|jgi:hypothetical protein
MKVARFVLSLLIPASVVITSAACSNPLSDLFGSPSSPSNNTSTDTFSGSLAPSGSLIFTFPVATAGNVAVTLTAVSPAATGPLALGMGPSSNGTCTIATSTGGATAGANPQLSATENPGNYCVQVSDPGSLTTTSTVTVTVAHP